MYKLYIKNMVCDRCNMVVENELKKLGIVPVSVQLGQINLATPLSKPQLHLLNQSFTALGFEILDNPKKQTIEKIKQLLISKIQSMEAEEHFSISKFVSNALQKDYASLSKLFSQVAGITIEQFYILQKIEKVKELIFYNQLSLSEIAWKMGYSSVQHLSTQFKKITGLTPSQMKATTDFRRLPLDSIQKL